MRAKQTLRGKLAWVTGITVLSVGVASIGIIFAQSYFNLKFRTQSIAESMFKATKLQNDLLIPTFIVDEQSRGRPLVLDRIKQDEDLYDAKVVSNNSEIPSGFPDCVVSSEPTSCLSTENDAIATVTPIVDSGQNFGHLMKIKRLDSAFTEDHSGRSVGMVSIALFLTFGLLFLALNRITSREVPKELSELVNWVESNLKEGTHERTPDLKFEELRILGKRIGELIDQHDRARDQAVIGQLTSGIMHDIRTPLQSVVSALMLVDETKNPAKRIEMLENLYRMNAAKIPIIGNIIETTLDGAREIHVQKQDTDLIEILRIAINLNSELAKRKKVKIDIVNPQEISSVRIDSTQMFRVLSNLLKNAIEASGSVAQAPQITVLLAKISDDKVSISVEDNGPGVAGKEEKLFRLFRSKKLHGSGLGLLISKKIVEAHGGTIKAGKSEGLGGAKFEIIISASASTSTSLPLKEASV